MSGAGCPARGARSPRRSRPRGSESRSGWTWQGKQNVAAASAARTPETTSKLLSPRPPRPSRTIERIRRHSIPHGARGARVLPQPVPPLTGRSVALASWKGLPGGRSAPDRELRRIRVWRPIRGLRTSVVREAVTVWAPGTASPFGGGAATGRARATNRRTCRAGGISRASGAGDRSAPAGRGGARWGGRRRAWRAAAGGVRGGAASYDRSFAEWTSDGDCPIAPPASAQPRP